jgi:SAM-dependent methyltransferase
VTIYLAIALLSAATLAYEVLLLRLFAITQWHHFAYMAISIALLGFGASGTFLFLAQRWLKPRFIFAFAANSAAFGITALTGFVLAQRLPFNALQVVWEPLQLLYLLVLYPLLALPFFAAANCIGLAFARFGDKIGRVYAFNLVGSGVGALGLVGLLHLLYPESALRLVAGLGLGAAALAQLSDKRYRVWAAGLGAAALIVPIIAPASWTALRLSPYKSLSMALQVPGTELLGETSSPLGLLTVVRSPLVPFRHAPGLSLNNVIEPSPQLGVFTDGNGMTAITAFDGDLQPFTYLGFTTAALPYHLLEKPRTLILGAGGGADVLQALYHKAAAVDAVELDLRMIRLVNQTHRAFAGDVYARPDVRVHVAEARAFVAASRNSWDLIQIPLLDSFAAAAAGVHGLSESYVYTVEAFREYLRHLEPGGYLAITRWLKLPPRDSLKLFATALEALKQEGMVEPNRSLAMIRSWNTITLLVRNGKIGSQGAATVRRFSRERSFDLVFLPGLAPDEPNRANILQASYFFDGARALAGPGRGDFLRRYKFDVRPTTDDRPYFFDFFRWRSLPEFLELRTRSGAALIEWGYTILFATLLQAALLSALLILLPLWLRRRVRAVGSPDRWRVLAYFLCLGLAFLFVEIAFIQGFILFLGHPIYAVAVVLAGFLTFAGIGSGAAHAFSARIAAGRFSRLTPIGAAVLAIAGIALLYVLVLPTVFAGLVVLHEGARIALSLTLIAPLGFFMGMPFPLGLSRVSAHFPELVPWAWGISGCFSVISAILATILAIHFGFTAVVVLAAILYLAAGVIFHAPLTGLPKEAGTGLTSASPAAS